MKHEENLRKPNETGASRDPEKDDGVGARGRLQNLAVQLRTSYR